MALALAKPAGRPPREVAQAIVDALPPAPFVQKVEVAGPGFLNVFTTDDWLHDVLRDIAAARAPRTGAASPTGRRVQVEFVSANPTGPLHVGHARNAVLGDAIARLLEAMGETVEREYYFNDAGAQMDRFGASVEARYLQALGREAPMPEDGYAGAYVIDLAEEIVAAHGDAFADLPREERVAALLDEGSRRVLDGIAATLERFGVRFDVFFSEAELARKGEIASAVDRLREAGYAFESEGAVLVPLDGVRRRQGSRDRALQRRAHVLRGGLRVPDRQVLARLRPRDLRVGRRPPRRRRARQGRRGGARDRPGGRRDRCCTSSWRSCAAARP